VFRLDEVTASHKTDVGDEQIRLPERHLSGDCPFRRLSAPERSNSLRRTLPGREYVPFPFGHPTLGGIDLEK